MDYFSKFVKFLKEHYQEPESEAYSFLGDCIETTKIHELIFFMQEMYRERNPSTQAYFTWEINDEDGECLVKVTLAFRIEKYVYRFIVYDFLLDNCESKEEFNTAMENLMIEIEKRERLLLSYLKELGIINPSLRVD